MIVLMLELIKLTTDFGLLVLIWIVQLIIYPSFRFYTPEDLQKWHRQYTKRITAVVMPLMLTQLMVYVLQLFDGFAVYNLISVVVVFLLWLITFAVFVPLHQMIETNTFKTSTLSNLVKYNWIRTVLWSLLFLISLCHELFNR